MNDNDNDNIKSVLSYFGIKEELPQHYQKKKISATEKKDASVFCDDIDTISFNDETSAKKNQCFILVRRNSLFKKSSRREKYF